MKNSLEILRKEFEELKHNPMYEFEYRIELFEQNDFYKWKITSLGPKDTPYANGIFFIKVEFPMDYPNSAPRIYFLTRFCHPNVNLSNGYVCVNFLKSNWNKSPKVREILTKLYSIYYLVNPDSPFDVDLAYLYKKDREVYYLQVIFETHKYAKIDSFEDFKSFYKWKLSLPSNKKSNENSNKILNNENIKLTFNINGEPIKKCINCNSNMRIEELRTSISKMAGRDLMWEIYIYEGRKLDENLTLGENGLKSQSFITVISDVHY